jgi:hypothetical protein
MYEAPFRGAIADLKDALSSVRGVSDVYGTGRQLAIAITHIETALLWVKEAAEKAEY